MYSSTSNLYSSLPSDHSRQMAQSFSIDSSNDLFSNRSSSSNSLSLSDSVKEFKPHSSSHAITNSHEQSDNKIQQFIDDNGSIKNSIDIKEFIRILQSEKNTKNRLFAISALISSNSLSILEK